MTMSLEENVKALIPQMTLQIADAIREQAMNTLKHSTAQAIADEIKKYVAETIMPLVREDLEANQLEIRAAVVAAVKGVGEQLAAALVANAQEKLTGYRGEELLKNVFGPMFRGY